MQVKTMSAIVLLVIVFTGVGCKDDAAPASKDVRPHDVLTEAVGAELGGILKSKAVLGKLPPGWTIVSADIQATEITMKLTGPGGAAGECKLLRKDSPGATSGKWFVVKAAAGFDWMKDLGLAVDGAFGKTPWTTIVQEAEGEPEGDTPKEPKGEGPGEGKPGDEPAEGAAEAKPQEKPAEGAVEVKPPAPGQPTEASPAAKPAPPEAPKNNP